MIVLVIGKIGTGKSTVCQILKNLGANVINADKVVADLYRPGKEGNKQIHKFFGPEYIKTDGNINRPRLRKEAFSSAAKLFMLNSLIHPLAYKEVAKKVEKTPGKLYFLEAIATYKLLVDAIVLVKTPFEIAKERNKHRQINVTEFKKIFNSLQLPKKVDYTIDNRNTVKELEKKVKTIYQEICQKMLMKP